MAGIRVQNLHKAYSSRQGEKVVLGGVNLEVRDGEFVALLGPSGCGKSTLLNILSGLDRDYRGSVSFTGVRGQPRIGYMFQEARLLPWRTVRQNVRFALDQDDGRVEGWLERVGLKAYSDFYPNQLSVGMQHRVALARALIRDPAVLLLDEPFSSLDEITAMSMRAEVLELWKEQQGTVVLVTHNPLEAVYLADRVLVMTASPGRIVAELSLSEKLPRPRDPEDRRLWELSREAVHLLSPHLSKQASLDRATGR